MAAKQKEFPKVLTLDGKELEEGKTLRFVASPTGEAVVDLACKLKGEKAVYVALSRKAFEQAVTSGALAEALNASVAEGLTETVEALLEKALLSALGLGRKGGLLAIGAEEVEKALRKETPLHILVAVDSGGNVSKKATLWHAHGVEVSKGLTKNALQNALGIANTAVVAWQNKKGRFITNALTRYLEFNKG